MKFFKNSLAIICLSYFLIPSIWAQSNTVSTGGNASSSTGSVSYSTGQIDYISAVGAPGNLNQGLQQPFEFYIITGTEEIDIDLNVRAFPNPTDYFISLEINLDDLSNLHYQIFNVHAQMIDQQKIHSKNTQIDLLSLINGQYVLKVNRNKNEIKTFKIIKNQ